MRWKSRMREKNNNNNSNALRHLNSWALRSPRDFAGWWDGFFSGILTFLKIAFFHFKNVGHSNHCFGSPVWPFLHHLHLPTSSWQWQQTHKAFCHLLKTCAYNLLTTQRSKYTLTVRHMFTHVFEQRKSLIAYT